jgi:integrase/recombinase XerD
MEKSVTTLMEQYRRYLKLERSVSPNTIDAYLTDVTKLMLFLDDDHIQPTDVKLDDLHRFAASLHDIGIHPRSQARILSGIRSFYRYLVLDGYITDDPTELLEAPKIGEHLPEVLSIDEIDRIEAAIDLSTAEGQRNLAIIEVLFSCGLRVSELCHLHLSDLYLDEKFLRILGKGNKERLVPISDKAIHELQLWFTDRCHIDIRPGEDDYVFLSIRRGTHLSRIMVFHFIKQLAEAANIQKVISPHTFRHSFATALLEGGANLRAIQTMLGHENIATTEIYTHIDRTHLRDEILNHHPRNIMHR